MKLDPESLKVDISMKGDVKGGGERYIRVTHKPSGISEEGYYKNNADTIKRLEERVLGLKE